MGPQPPPSLQGRTAHGKIPYLVYILGLGKQLKGPIGGVSGAPLGSIRKGWSEGAKRAHIA